MPSNVTCWLSMGKVEQLLLFLSLSWGGECCRDADGSTLGYTVSMCTAEAQTSCPNFQPSPSSMSCPWSGAGDNSVIHDPSNGTLQDGTGILFRLEFSALSLNPGFGTLPKAPVSTGNGKEGMTHLSPFLQNNPSHRLQGGWLQLDPSFSDKSGQVAQVNVVFQWAQLLLDFFFFFWQFKRRVLAPGGAHVFSSAFYAVVFRWRNKNNHWGIPWKLPERLLCCFPRNLFQNV